MKPTRPIICDYCGRTGTSLYEMVGDNCVRRFRTGWNGTLYCSKDCEIKELKRLFSSVPYTGTCIRLPDHIQREIDERWKDED